MMTATRHSHYACADRSGAGRSGAGRSGAGRSGAGRSGAGRPEAAVPGGYGSPFHVPVLAAEVVEALVTDPAGYYIDGTLGGGGHAAALLDALAPGGRVVGIDQDEEALATARDRLGGDDRFHAVRGNFGDLETLLAAEGLLPVDGVLLDLGVSSHQIDEPARGFSFQGDGPLDMRMDQRHSLTAADVVNEWEAEALRNVLYTYGEERRAKTIVRAVLEARPVETTGALAAAVRRVVPEREEVKTLARVFQALRIAVNRELDVLERALEAGPRVLRPGGRMAVISYHSLEDRRAKRFFRYGNFENEPVRDFFGNLITPWARIIDGPARAGEAEIARNPRARSARLRVAAYQPPGDGPEPPTL